MKLLSGLAEIGDFLKCSVRAVAREIEKEGLPCRKVAGAYATTDRLLEAWIAERTAEKAKEVVETPDLIGAAEIAAFLGLRVDAVLKEIEEGDLPARIEGGEYVTTAEALQGWIEAGREGEK